MTIQPNLSAADIEREGVRQLVDGAVTGSLDFPADEDYFAFSPLADRGYRISVDAAIDTALGLHALPGLAALAEDADTGPGHNPEILIETGRAPEQWIIQVDFDNADEPGRVFGGFGPLGAYRLLIEDLGPIDPLPPQVPGDTVGDTVATAAALGSAFVTGGGFETAGDRDVYAVLLESGRSYEATLSAGGAPELALLDGSGAELDAATGDGGPAGLAIAPAETGVFYLAAADPGAAVPADYAIALTDLGPEPPAAEAGDLAGDSVATAAPAEIGRPVTGRFDDAGDVDVYEIALSAGTAYHFDAVQTSAGVDPRLVLRDFSGAVLDEDEDGGDQGDAALDFVAEVSDLYYLELSDESGGSGTYALESQALDGVDATTTEAMSIALLFEAAFGRQAAFPGLNFWIDELEFGSSLNRIADRFATSPEFTERFGPVESLSGEDYVTLLFTNVLERPADEIAQAGLDFWTGVAERPGVDAGDMLLAFSESAENLASSPEILTLEPVSDGIWDFVA